MYVDMVNTTNTRCNLRGLIKFKVRPSVPSFFLLFYRVCARVVLPSPLPLVRRIVLLSRVCARACRPPPRSYPV